MKLSSPKQITFWIAVAVAVVGVVASLVTIPVLSGLAFWLVVAAFVLLAVACMVDGL